MASTLLRWLPWKASRTGLHFAACNPSGSTANGPLSCGSGSKDKAPGGLDGLAETSSRQEGTVRDIGGAGRWMEHASGERRGAVPLSSTAWQGGPRQVTPPRPSPTLRCSSLRGTAGSRKKSAQQDPNLPAVPGRREQLSRPCPQGEGVALAHDVGVWPGERARPPDLVKPLRPGLPTLKQEPASPGSGRIELAVKGAKYHPFLSRAARSSLRMCLKHRLRPSAPGLDVLLCTELYRQREVQSYPESFPSAREVGYQ